MQSISSIIAEELSVQVQQVESAIQLLNEGASVPFIARYRKEMTGSLDDTQLRNLEQRLAYLTDMSERKLSILKSIKAQGKLTEELKNQIMAVTTKISLEDLYLPFKPRRVTKGQLAIEAGLLPLADILLSDRSVLPEDAAILFLNEDKKVNEIGDALDGARYILMDRFSMDAQLIGKIRTYIQDNGVLQSEVCDGKDAQGAKFKDYFQYSERLSVIPSHRALALLRGSNESILKLKVNADPLNEDKMKDSYCEQIILDHLKLKLSNSLNDLWLRKVIKWTWKIKISTQLESEFLSVLKDSAEVDAIKVFADNMQDLLMAAPAGAKVTMGLDPGLRSGTKVAVVGCTGKLLATVTIYPHAPQNKWNESVAVLTSMIAEYGVDLIAIGNGTASRETDRLASELVKSVGSSKLKKLIVSEAGASVYSASELAANEFPNLDVTLRGAVSIARRLQDPLAELVKIDPRAIGVGQYQHDVCQFQLSKSLNGVVETCVNSVGVDLNTASVPLLAQVSGLNKRIAQNIVDHRDAEGPFATRDALKNVSRLGEKAFEQSAGFLKIIGGKNALDNSSVHPEAYLAVESMARRSGVPLNDIIGNSGVLKKLNPADFVSETYGLPTIKDIITELAKPGRDPRPEFKAAVFMEGVENIGDLKMGMILDGVISNVTAFGAFVDIGVHQDGLLHISTLSSKFIKDPREVVKTGDIVKVKVLDIDLSLKRIGLTMRLEDDVKSVSRHNHSSDFKSGSRRSAFAKPEQKVSNSALADALKIALGA